MTVKLFSKEQPLDRIIICEQGDHILQQKSLAVFKQLPCIVDLQKTVIPIHHPLM
jgi:hypothetical protein